MSPHSPSVGLFPRKCPTSFVIGKKRYYLSGVGHCIDVIPEQSVQEQQQPRKRPNVIEQRLYRVFQSGREIEAILRFGKGGDLIVVFSTTHVAVCSLRKVLKGGSLPCNFTAPIPSHFTNACNFSQNIIMGDSLGDNAIQFQIISSRPSVSLYHLEILDNEIVLKEAAEYPLTSCQQFSKQVPYRAQPAAPNAPEALIIVYEEGNPFAMMYDDKRSTASMINTDPKLPEVWNVEVDILVVLDHAIYILTEDRLFIFEYMNDTIYTYVFTTETQRSCVQRNWDQETLSSREPEKSRRYRILCQFNKNVIVAAVEDSIHFFTLESHATCVYSSKLSIGPICSMTVNGEELLVGGAFGGFSIVHPDPNLLQRTRSTVEAFQTGGQVFIVHLDHYFLKDTGEGLYFGQDKSLVMKGIQAILAVNSKGEAVYKEKGKFRRGTIKNRMIVRAKTIPNVKVDKAVFLNDDTLVISEEIGLGTHFHIYGDNSVFPHQVACGTTEFRENACVLIPLRNGKSSLLVGCKNLLFYTRYDKHTLRHPSLTQFQMAAWTPFPGSKLSIHKEAKEKLFLPEEDYICAFTLRHEFYFLLVLYASGHVMKLHYHTDCPDHDPTCYDLHLYPSAYLKTPIHDAHRFIADAQCVLVAGSDAPDYFRITSKKPKEVQPVKFHCLFYDVGNGTLFASVPLSGFYEDIRRPLSYFAQRHEAQLLFKTASSELVAAASREVVYVSPLLMDVPNEVGVAALPDGSSLLAATGKYVCLFVYQPHYARWTRINHYCWSVDYECPRFTQVENRKCLLGVACRDGIEILRIELQTEAGGIPSCTIRPFKHVHYGNRELPFTLGGWKTRFDFHLDTGSNPFTDFIMLCVVLTERKPKDKVPRMLLCTVEFVIEKNHTKRINMGAEATILGKKTIPFKGKGLHDAQLEILFSPNQEAENFDDDFVILLRTANRRALIEGSIMHWETTTRDDFEPSACMKRPEEKPTSSMQCLLSVKDQYESYKSTVVSAHQDGNLRWRLPFPKLNKKNEWMMQCGVDGQRILDIVAGRCLLLGDDRIVTTVIRTPNNYSFVYVDEDDVKELKLECRQTTVAGLDLLHGAAPSVKTTVLGDGSALAYGDFLHVVAPCWNCLEKIESKEAKQTASVKDSA